MEIKLNPNNIQSVQYRLNENKTVNMHFDIDGFLADVDVEEALSYNPENDKAKKPLINEVQKDEESITTDIIKKTADGEWKNKMKDVLDKCDTIEKEVFEEMADKYTPTNFNSEDCWKRPKLDEYRKKKGFPDEEDEKKVIIESKKDIFGTTIGPEEGVEINGKQIVIKEYNTNVDDYGKNL